MSTQETMKGKVVIVTGGGSGIAGCVMKKIKFLLIVMDAILISTMTICLTNPRTIDAAEICRIVNIRSYQVIEPETSFIKKGDCVVWVNWGRTDLRVIFREGKTCLDRTKAPAGFKMDVSGCYLTDRLPFGGTSSLLFPVEGTFNFEVEFPGVKTLRGSVVVK